VQAAGESGVEVRAHLRRLVGRIRSHRPETRILPRGDGHCGRHEAMPETSELKRAEVGTVRGRPIKVGARVFESATRIRIALGCPDKELFFAVLAAILGPTEAQPH